MKSINYHTKSLKDNKNDCTYIGYIAHDITPGQSKTKIFKSDSMNNVQTELAAIKMALLDIENSYDAQTRYNVYTDSINVLDLIADNDYSKYSEVQEINDILNKIGQNIGMFEFVNDNDGFFSTGNRLLGIKSARQVHSGENLITEALRGAKRSGIAERYVSTPFIIKL